VLGLRDGDSLEDDGTAEGSFEGAMLEVGTTDG